MGRRPTWFPFPSSMSAKAGRSARRLTGARARALRDDCVAWLLPPARMLLPAVDALTLLWLERSRSPYVADIKAIAGALGFPGIWFLNGAYQWCCTAVARDEDGVPWLARTLDW